MFLQDRAEHYIHQSLPLREFWEIFSTGHLVRLFLIPDKISLVFVECSFRGAKSDAYKSLKEIHVLGAWMHVSKISGCQFASREEVVLIFWKALSHQESFNR
jgi:hypothetical protein